METEGELEKSYNPFPYTAWLKVDLVKPSSQLQLVVPVQSLTKSCNAVITVCYLKSKKEY